MAERPRPDWLAYITVADLNDSLGIARFLRHLTRFD